MYQCNQSVLQVKETESHNMMEGDLDTHHLN